MLKTKCVVNAEKLGCFWDVCQSSPLKRMVAALLQDKNLRTKEVFDHPKECLSYTFSLLCSIIDSAPYSRNHSIVLFMLRAHPV